MCKKLYILFLLIVLGAVSAMAASVRISVSPQRGKNRIDVGDIFYLNINVSNISEAPAKPTLHGAKVVYFDRTSESSSFSSVNGVSSQTYSAVYTATLRAEKEGTYSYGPISVAGVRSNSVRYSIGSQSGTQSSGSSSSQQGHQDASDDDSKPKFIGRGDGNLFLRASVSSSSAYEQQALVYTVKLYTTYDGIKFIGATAAPKFDGFVVEESKDISNSLTLENYQGKTYATAVIARYIIFPQMTGSLKVSGNTYTVSVDRREYYHDPFWGNLSFGVAPLQLNVTPNDLVIDVRSLPTPKPADFSGAVGKFKITSQLKSSDFKTNQAAVIVYKVEGTGNIKYVQLPDLSALYPPEIEVYTPKTTQNVNVGGSSVTGSVTFDYSFMPLDEGEFRIPDVKLVYFNPESGKYETSVAKGYTINVGKGKASDKNAAKHTRFDAKLQKVETSKLTKENRPMVYGIVYWLWYIIPVVLLAGVFITYRRYVSSHADMVAFNSRRANKIARRRLRRAAAAMKRNSADEFYDELLTAMWGYLGDKLKMPTSSLMRDNVRQVMTERGVSQENIDHFIKMIDDAEFAKYSSAGGTENLQMAYEDAADMIDSLEKEFKK